VRHTFGTAMIAKADILRVMEWMGHADVQTTRGYLHDRPRPDDARIADEAFAATELARPSPRRGDAEGRRDSSEWR
jgi:hypothetical protein